MLRGYKEIADRLGTFWKTPVSMTSVLRWAGKGADPLPLRRINPSAGERGIVIADPDELRAWAMRKMQ